MAARLPCRVLQAERGGHAASRGVRSVPRPTGIHVRVGSPRQLPAVLHMRSSGRGNLLHARAAQVRRAATRQRAGAVVCTERLHAPAWHTGGSDVHGPLPRIRNGAGSHVGGSGAASARYRKRGQVRVGIEDEGGEKTIVTNVIKNYELLDTRQLWAADAITKGVAGFVFGVVTLGFVQALPTRHAA